MSHNTHDNTDSDHRERQWVIRTAEHWFHLCDTEEHQHQLTGDVLNSFVQNLTSMVTDYIVDWVAAQRKSIDLLFPRIKKKKRALFYLGGVLSPMVGDHR